MKKVVVIAAHPDDEVLGCGGTIAKHSFCKDQVHILFLSNGVASRFEKEATEQNNIESQARLEMAHNANKILGTTSLDFLYYPDNRMDSVDRLDIIKSIEKFLSKHQPEIVYTHHAGDLNIDHQRVHQAVITACRPIPNYHVKTLLFFEVASSTEWQTPSSAPYFKPNWFVDISDFLSLKEQAIQAYAHEMRPYPHVRSIEALEYLSRWRGATIGVKAAESFVLGRTII